MLFTNLGRFFSWVLFFTSLVGLIACGGSGGTAAPDNSEDSIDNSSYSISGSVSGLSNNSVVLQQNGGDNLTVLTNGSFSFSTSIKTGSTYSVTVLTQPIFPTQTCTVSNGTGTVIAKDVTSVSINCNPPSINSFELVDPTPGANNQFGNQVVLLANGNIVVSDHADSSVTTNNGAIHLYNPITQTLINSIYGDNDDDKLGLDGIVALANGNFVIASSLDDVSNITDAGSVRLIDGTSGIQIGLTLAGDSAYDRLGRDSITALANSNFVIASANDTEGGVGNSGSVRLVNGATGVQIGNAIVGDVPGDRLGLNGIYALGNSNFVIASSMDNEGGLSSAGSIRLINGSTGTQIGSTIAGDTAGDQLGSRSVTVLGNDNFVVASPFYDQGGIVNASSIRLINGTTGTQIGTPIVGDVSGDNLGLNGIAVLANNNFIIASSNDDEGGIVDSGSVRLVNGTTGVQIGTPIVGDQISDHIGRNGTIALPNNNYVIGSNLDDVNNINNAGSVRLVNGVTGIEIGDPVSGDNENDSLGSNSLTALDNNNYVVVSAGDNVLGLNGAGSVRLVNGITGIQIGSPFFGDKAFNNFGFHGVTVLANNNYVIASANDDVNGISRAGTVKLVNGATGNLIASIEGNNDADYIGSSGVTALNNNYFIIASQKDDENGYKDIGSFRIINGVNGEQVGDTILGSAADDLQQMTVTNSTTDGYFIIGMPNADKNDLINSGRVLLIAQ